MNALRLPAGAAWVLLVSVILAGGCSTAADQSLTTTPASPSESPEVACTRQVAYWVGETLRRSPDQGFDYQHMGLSGRTYDVVRSVTVKARAEGRSDPTWVAQQARSACREAIERQDRTTPPSSGWP